MHLTGFTRASIAQAIAGRLRARGLGACRRGAAAVEFALLSLPFLTMIFGFIATNAVYLSLAAMQGSAMNAAMLMATGQITSFQSKAVTCSSSLTSTQAEYYACQNLPAWATFSVNASESCTSPATVTVNLSSSGTALGDVYGFFTGKSVSTQSVLMKQGTCP